MAERIHTMRHAPMEDAALAALGGDDFSDALRYVWRKFFAHAAQMDLEGFFDLDAYRDMLACAHAASVLPGFGGDAQSLKREIAGWRGCFGDRTVSLPSEVSNALLGRAA